MDDFYFHIISVQGRSELKSRVNPLCGEMDPPPSFIFVQTQNRLYKVSKIYFKG